MIRHKTNISIYHISLSSYHDNLLKGLIGFSLWFSHILEFRIGWKYNKLWQYSEHLQPIQWKDAWHNIIQKAAWKQPNQYCISCRRCNKAYLGETRHGLNTRISELTSTTTGLPTPRWYILRKLDKQQKWRKHK